MRSESQGTILAKGNSISVAIPQRFPFLCIRDDTIQIVWGLWVQSHEERAWVQNQAQAFERPEDSMALNALVANFRFPRPKAPNMT